MTSDPDLLDARPVRLGGQVLDVATHGPADGPVVLMLHGFPASRATFAPVAPLLGAAGARVVVPDLRGYSPGARPADPAAYRIERLVEDVVGLVDALGVTSVHLVGHDWGAALAWAVAAWHPDRLRSLTALSVPHPRALAWARAHDADQQEGSAYVDLLRLPGKAERVLLEDDARRLRAMFSPQVDPRLVERHVRLLQQPGALTGALGWYRSQDTVLDRLDPVEVPVTFVWGSEDPALRRAGAERCGDFVTGPFRFVELAGADHWIPELHPDAVAEAVLRHVDPDPT